MFSASSIPASEYHAMGQRAPWEPVKKRVRNSQGERSVKATKRRRKKQIDPKIQPEEEQKQRENQRQREYDAMFVRKTSEMPEWWSEGIPSAQERLNAAIEFQEQKKDTEDDSFDLNDLTRSVFVALKKLSAKINQNATKAEMEQSKMNLKGLNEKYGKYFGFSNLSCVSTSFLESVINYEMNQNNLNVEQARDYKNNVLDIWTEYINSQILPYLFQPASILKTNQDSFQNINNQLWEIMTVVKYQWDVLHSGCTVPTSDEGKQSNLTGFLMRENRCNCICLTALLLVTADCLGLFPDLIHGEEIDGIFSVVTSSGLIIEGPPKQKSFYVVHSINSGKDFVNGLKNYS